MRYRNDVIRSVLLLLLLLLQIRANFGMMLARDYASCHVARSTLTSNAGSKQRAKTQIACKQSGFKSLYRQLDEQDSCTATANKSQVANACYSSNVCGHSTTVYL